MKVRRPDLARYPGRYVALDLVSDEVLADAKRHWKGVTVQLADAGMLTEEYDNGYDWFHQGESLLFLAGICVGAANIWLTVRGARDHAEDRPLAPQPAE